MRLLDLFCGAGGAAMGYHRAGFTQIVGVDNRPQPRYPFTFHQRDAMDVLAHLAAHAKIGTPMPYDAIHASPPCQGYSALRHLPWLKDKVYPLLLEPVRELLNVIGLPWVIENVERALLAGIVLCGTDFGLPIYRHRRFGSNILLLSPPHRQHEVVIGHGRMVNDRRKGSLNNSSAKGAWGNQTIVTVAGGQCSKPEAERALGIDWMQKPELMQAIPPAYTEFIGRQLIAAIQKAS
jgi:DNA (cytosine-5)-methyltransferase 1